MNVYVLDDWEESHGEFTGPERPWSSWCKSMSPCVWAPGEGLLVRPLNSALSDRGLVIVHWSYLRGKYVGEDVEKDAAAMKGLQNFVEGHPGFKVIVISGNNLVGRSGIDGKLYFRPIKVTCNPDDPFGVRYLGEFYRAVRGGNGLGTEVDFTLLEPEPRETLLAVGRLVARGLSVSEDQWTRAESQCRRLVRRGDGWEPLDGSHVDWLVSPARWPADFLIEPESRRRFAEAVEAVLQGA